MRLRSFLLVLVIWGCGKDDEHDDHDDLTSEVISCEEAIGRLESCCHAFIGTRDGQCLDEDYQKTGGGCVYDDYDSLQKIRRRPEMTLDESRCVRELSCDKITAKGICDRVKRNGLRGNESYEYDDHIDSYGDISTAKTYPHEAVCP